MNKDWEVHNAQQATEADKICTASVQLSHSCHADSLRVQPDLENVDVVGEVIREGGRLAAA